MTIRAAAGRGGTLASWPQAKVAGILASLADGKAIRRIGPGQGALFVITFSVASKRAIPSALVQDLSLTNSSRPLEGPPVVDESSFAVGVSKRAPVTLGPPLVGGGWVVSDGCCTAPHHVRSTQPFGGRLRTVQRFAIDWERLDARGRLFVGNRKVLTNWAGYGQPVLAVGAGTVVHAVNDQPDQIPGQAPVGITPANADGNGVILRLDAATSFMRT